MSQKLIVLMAFNRAEDGELVPAFEAREMPSEARAKQEAAMMRDKYAGVVAWSRDASPDVGDYGPSTILASYGDVPDME